MITSQVEHAAVHTPDVTMARDRVTDLFCARGLEPRRGLDLHVDARRVGAEGHRVGLVDMDYGSTVRITPEPLESFYLVQIPSRGAARVHHEATEVHSDSSQASVLSPRSGTTMTWFAGSPQFVVYLDRAIIEECFASLTGSSLTEPLVFDVGMPLTSPSAQSWLRTVSCLRAELGHGASDRSVRHADVLARSVAAQLLETHRHSRSSLIARGGTASRLTARRAATYLEEHLDEPLTIAGVAAAQGVCTRVLQEAFRRELDTTPLLYLRQLRLRVARARLLTASAGVSVTEIALGVGLTHLGRFSVMYRAAYGESPSETLRAS